MTRIKICGLHRPEDIAAANECQPDYVGFVFASSRRQVTPDTAQRLRSRLHDSITAVGVFVDEPAENIAALVRAGVIDMVQLHGSEQADFIARLKQAVGVPIIKAVAMGRQASGRKKQACHPADVGTARTPHLPDTLAGYHLADYLLFDSAQAGSGARFDWGQLPVLDGSGLVQPCFLAGGIDCDTIAAALELKPFAVDISSGAETDGLKDRSKMHYLVQQVRSYERSV